MSILVVGSVALDTIKTPFGKRREVLGGSATYFSLSARFFSRVNLVAVVGKDFPRRYLTSLKNKGIDLKGLAVIEGETFRWEGAYDWDFNNANTISTRLNVFSNFNPELPEEYKDSEYVFLANIDPEIQERVLRQVLNPRLVACDTMNHWIKSKRAHLVKFLKKVDIFLLNDSEARQLSGENNLVKAARTIMKFGPKRVLIKKGEHGAVLFSKNSAFCMPAFLLESIFDPTGAGDTFAGGFMGYLAKSNVLTEMNMRRAVVYASVMATFAVEEFSVGRLISITEEDIRARLKQFVKLISY